MRGRLERERRKKAKGDKHARNSSYVSGRSGEFWSVFAFGLCRSRRGHWGWYSGRQGRGSGGPESERIWQHTDDGDHRYGAGRSDCNLWIGNCIREVVTAKECG